MIPCEALKAAIHNLRLWITVSVNTCMAAAIRTTAGGGKYSAHASRVTKAIDDFARFFPIENSIANISDRIPSAINIDSPMMCRIGIAASSPQGLATPM
jgi:hypothetical protein